MIGSAIFSMTDSGTGVGPGVKRRFFNEAPLVFTVQPEARSKPDQTTPAKAGAAFVWSLRPLRHVVFEMDVKVVDDSTRSKTCSCRRKTVCGMFRHRLDLSQRDSGSLGYRGRAETLPPPTSNRRGAEQKVRSTRGASSRIVEFSRFSQSQRERAGVLPYTLHSLSRCHDC